MESALQASTEALAQPQPAQVLLAKDRLLAALDVTSAPPLSFAVNTPALLFVAPAGDTPLGGLAGAGAVVDVTACAAQSAAASPPAFGQAFAVVARDASGAACRVASDAFAGELRDAQARPLACEVAFAEQKEGTHLVTYRLPPSTPSQTLSLRVHLFGEPIRGSPFALPMYTGCTIAQAGSKLTLSKDKRTVTKAASSNCWDAAAVGTPCSKFSLRVVRKCTCLTVGFSTTASVNLEGFNHENNTGYYLNLFNGSLYGIGHSRAKAYTSGCSNAPGTVVTCEWRPAEGSIRFHCNGTDRGVAYTGVPSSGLLPAFDLYHADCCFERCANF